MAFATVDSGDWIIEHGQPRRFESSPFGHRESCGKCGTPLTIRVEFQPETVDFSIATLDDPGAVAPGFHIFWTSKVP